MATETFKFSTNPELEAKVRDVVGLYLNPPTNAIVLGGREKPDPSTQPDAANLADATGVAGESEIGLPKERNHPVRGIGGGHGRGG